MELPKPPELTNLTKAQLNKLSTCNLLQNKSVGQDTQAYNIVKFDHGSCGSNKHKKENEDLKSYALMASFENTPKQAIGSCILDRFY